METREQLQTRRDELTDLINGDGAWADTAGWRREQEAIDAIINPERAKRDARNARARAARRLNPHPNGGHTQRRERR